MRMFYCFHYTPQNNYSCFLVWLSQRYIDCQPDHKTMMFAGASLASAIFCSFHHQGDRKARPCVDYETTMIEKMRQRSDSASGQIQDADSQIRLRPMGSLFFATEKDYNLFAASSLFCHHHCRATCYKAADHEGSTQTLVVVACFPRRRR